MKTENKPGYQTAIGNIYDCLKERQKELKKNPTETENIIWNNIRNIQLGHKFRRQHIIGDYIVDFVCLKKKLVIEIDGKYHSTSKQIEKDQERTKYLEALGYEIIRFTNEEVICSLEKVIDQIRKRL